MIRFRYHVASLVAVVVALTVGIVVGSTALQNDVVSSVNEQTHRLDARNHTLAAKVADQQRQLASADAFERALLPVVVTGRLAGQSVTLVSLPGVSESLRRAMANALSSAGADVTADVRLRPALLDPAQREFLAALVSRLPAPASSPAKPAGPAAAVSALLGAVTAKPTSPPPSAATAATVTAAFADAGLATVSGANGSPPRSGSLALLLVPADPTRAVTDAVGTLAAAAVATADRAVVAGAGAGMSLIGGNKKWTAVTSADQASGQIAAVLALAGVRLTEPVTAKGAT